jgi:hypothetical protein
MQSHRMTARFGAAMRIALPPTHQSVISTEAAHSLIVSSVAENPLLHLDRFPQIPRTRLTGYNPTTIRICGELLSSIQSQS